MDLSATGADGGNVGKPTETVKIGDVSAIHMKVSLVTDVSSEPPVVFVLLGQSNAVGHGTPMAEEDIIQTPLKCVFGLNRTENQSYTVEALQWSGYASGGMNLGETQDHTYSLANCLARQWQDAIDGGAALPNLYIVQIAIGAQGVTEGYMWHPDREPKLIPGTLDTVDISLHPLTHHILSLLPQSFAQMGKQPQYVIHWRGGENDMTVPADTLKTQLLPIYQRLFGDYRQALGQDVPIVLHQLICPERAMEEDPTGEYLKSMDVINDCFQTLAREESISLFDARSCPLYDPNSRQHGIFIEDAVHYTPQLNNWAAEEICKALWP